MSGCNCDCCIKAAHDWPEKQAEVERLKAERDSDVKLLHDLTTKLNETVDIGERLLSLLGKAKETLSKCRDIIDDDLENRPARYALGPLHANVSVLLDEIKEARL